MTLTGEEEAELSKANTYHATEGFEYFPLDRAAGGYPDLPDPEVLAGLCNRLLAAIEAVCHQC